MEQLYDTEPGQPRVPLRATADGALRVAVVSGGSGGGGSGGDASAANQATQIATQGAPDNAPASGDSVTATQVAIAKRHNVLLTALLATPSDLVRDSAGVVFSPASCSHAYGYDSSGNLTTDTATDGAVVRVKTLAYTSGNMTAETKWVVQ
jgi:YD repeat-containing protein